LRWRLCVRKNLCADFLGLTVRFDEILQLCVQWITRLLLPRYYVGRCES